MFIVSCKIKMVIIAGGWGGVLGRGAWEDIIIRGVFEKQTWRTKKPADVEIRGTAQWSQRESRREELWWAMLGKGYMGIRGEAKWIKGGTTSSSIKFLQKIIYNYFSAYEVVSNVTHIH